MAKTKIKGTIEAWENGELGQDEKHVKKSTLNMDDLDDSCGLQMISIRMQRELLDDLKFLAEYHGIGYQPLMKQALRRFVDCEMKHIAREVMRVERKKTAGEKCEALDDEAQILACG